MTYTDADLTPERQLELIRSLQRQLDTLYELFSRLDERLDSVEKERQEVHA
jgi:hypothetical protein